MNGPTQHQEWTSGLRRRAAGLALPLALMLLAGLATRAAPAQNYNEGVLYAFTGGADGGFPQAGLVLDTRGNLYGTTMGGGSFGQGTVFQLAGSTKIVLYSFTGGADGGVPQAGLVDAEGNLYGTTLQGGTSGAGVVFKVDKTGKETVLYNFTGGADGANPEGVLVRDAQGNLYGTTSGGGAFSNGTVFKVDTAGALTVLHSFTGTPDGAVSYAGLVMDKQGNLYGTTSAGGVFGQGTVFKIDTTGNEIVLYSFGGIGGDGEIPNPGLVRDKQGNLYGTTVNGGISCGYGPSCGTVFKVDTAGNQTVLYRFTGFGGDGGNPHAGLVRDKQGNLYGTTFFGGDIECNQSSYPGCGTVFKVDTASNEAVLYTFAYNGQYGANPWAGLVQDAHGNLYGNTYIGGNVGGHMGAPCWPFGCGVVFTISLGTETTTTLTSGIDPSYAGQPAFFNVTVSSSKGAPPDGETVTFMEGTTVLGTVPLSFGSATFVTGPLPAGASEFTAMYGGDPNFASSTSNKVRQVVKKNATTTTLTSSPNPSIYLQPVTFTAVVWSDFGPPPDGEIVTFVQGKTVLGEGVLSIGQAMFGMVGLPLGTDDIRAVYAGDPDFLGSNSKVLQQVVKKAQER